MKNTLFKFLFGLAAGICLAEIHPISNHLFYLIPVFLSGIILCFFIRILNAFFLPIIISAGYLLHSFQIYHPNVSQSVSKPAIEVMSPIEYKKNSNRVLVKVIYTSPLPSLEDYAWVYFNKADSALNLLAPGNIIFTNTPLKKITQKPAPHQFDYVRYQKRKRIFYSMYLATGQYQINPNRYEFKNKLLSIHHFLASKIELSIPDKNHAAIALSLILGDRNSIDQELIETYSKIGIIHLLSVSGLHVGVFILLIQFIFRKLKTSRPLLRLVTILLFLIFYSLITGGSLPVVRCAIMFSIIEFGKYIQRNSHVLNSLAASALILLLYNTQFLFDIGFQLSYLALIGILLLHKKIYQKIFFENSLLDKIWEMCCSTLAAWLFTTPLVIYYFHNVSLLGNLANIAAIPIAALILYAGLLIIVFSFNIAIMNILGHCIDLLISSLNYIVECFYHLPFAFVSHVYISFLLTIILYTGLYALLQFCFTKKSTSFFAFLLCCMFSVIVFTEQKQTIKKTDFISITGDKKEPVLLVKQNNQLIYFSRDSAKNAQKTLQEIEHYYSIKKIKQSQSAVFRTNQETMVVLDQYNLKVDTTDYLICLTQNKYKIQEQLEHTFVRKAILARLYKEKDILEIQETLAHKKFGGLIHLDYSNPTLQL